MQLDANGMADVAYVHGRATSNLFISANEFTTNATARRIVFETLDTGGNARVTVAYADPTGTETTPFWAQRAAITTPLTTTLDASFMTFQWEATGDTLTAYVNDGGTIRSAHLGVVNTGGNMVLSPAGTVIVLVGGVIDTPTYEGGTTAVFQRSALTGDNAGISIIAGETGESKINFGFAAAPGDEDAGEIRYDHDGDILRFAIDTSVRLNYSVGAFAFQEATIISAAGNLTLAPVGNLIVTLAAANLSAAIGGAVVDGAALVLNNLSDRTFITSVGSQVHLPAQESNFDNASETIAVGAGIYLGVPTWTGDNASLTITDPAALYIAGVPVAGLNVLFTNPAMGILLADDVLFGLGTAAGVMALDSAGIAANAEVTGLIVGTSVHGATAANSLIISNVASDGDMMFLVNDGGNSIEMISMDASLADLALGSISVREIEMRTGSGDIVLNANGSVNITLSATDVDAFDAANATDSYYLINTVIATPGTIAHKWDNTDAAMADGATARFIQMSGTDYSMVLAGQTQVSTLNQGMALMLAAVTISQTGGAVVVDQASTLHIPVVTPGSSVTITANRMISTGVSDCFLTVGGVWTDTISTEKIKDNITPIRDLSEMIKQIQPSTWTYKHSKSLEDNDIQRYGIVVEELPDFLTVPGEGRRTQGVSGSVLGSFNTAAIKYLYDRIEELEWKLRKSLVA